MSLLDAKKSLDKVIEKARVHFYKPIQIAEILYRDRVYGDVALGDLATYRDRSKRWRDEICERFIGRTSSSSSRYQDDLFNETALPPRLLVLLGEENRLYQGVVESYIYRRFSQRFFQVRAGLSYLSHNRELFQLDQFLAQFWSEPSLRRSIDKVYEIVVYALFSTLVEQFDLTVKVILPEEKQPLLIEFADFAERVLLLSADNPTVHVKAKLHRMGTTNAADRGLDMWANFGLAFQIKHLSLTEELAESVVASALSDRVIIICKDSEEKTILSLLTQIGWRAKIQTIITEAELLLWYEKALRGELGSLMGNRILDLIREEIALEFPATNSTLFATFMHNRQYDQLDHPFWSVPSSTEQE